MDKTRKLAILLLLSFCFLPLEVRAKAPSPNFRVTNEMIYQQLMELREEHAVFKEKFKQIDKRFEEIDKRFEQIDRRFDDLRNDMNKRFEQVDKRITELREDMDERFNELSHHLDVITGIFTTLVVFVIGFAYWDRRTIIGKAKEEAVKEIESSGRLITVLRKKAKADKELEEILKELGLL